MLKYLVENVGSLKVTIDFWLFFEKEMLLRSLSAPGCALKTPCPSPISCIPYLGGGVFLDTLSGDPFRG